MTIKALYPSIEPSLNLDFANTKRLDPRITFTRASTATYVGESGLIQSAAVNEARFDHNPNTGESLGLLVEEARTNTITYSSIGLPDVNTQRYAGVAPDGTFTAALITDNNFATGYRNSPGAGTFNYSVFVKQGTSATFRVIYAGYGGTDWTFTFSTETLTVGGAWTNAKVEKYPNNWYKLSATSSTRDLYYYYFVADSATSTVYFWGAQVEAGSFPTSYIPTPATFSSRTSTATFYDSAGTVQTAASGVARSNTFFPDSNGVMRSAGLLLEAAGTNLLQQSAAISTTPWSLVNSASVTTNTTAAPDGTTTADTLGGTTTSSYIEQTIPWTASGNWTLSLFMKAGTSTRSKIAIVRSASQVHGTSIDWSGGVPSASSTFGCSVSFQALASGWYRVILQLTSVVHTSTNSLAITSDFTSGTGTVIIWGVQAEQTAYATSYIPTAAATVTRSADVSTSATVTRSADVASITGTSFTGWFNSSMGTFFTESSNDSLKSNIATSLYSGVNTVAFSLGSGGSRVYTPYLSYLSNSTIFAALFQYNGGGTEWGAALQNTLTSTANVSKLAVFTDTINNQTGLSTANQINVADKPVDPTRTGMLSYSLAQSLVIGYNSNFYGNYIGRIKRIAYYPVRLSNAQLLALTAP